MTESKSVGTRERILESSGELFRRQGYAGTGIKAILTASDAPYGSLYHFFPGGKEELGAAALREGGLTYLRLVDAFFPEGGDVLAGVEAFFDGAATVVEMTDYEDACPIATVALEVASTSEPMRVAADEAFESWLRLLAQRLTEAGIDPVRSRELAIELLCATEGAFLLARTSRTPEALHVAGRAALAAVRAALPA